MPNPNLSFSMALAANLADRGLGHACISPGSRNTPLIAGFAAEDRITKWPILDERSAGFFALGLARATRVPVALVCTSGTAAVEYHPAVVEASQSDIPLLVLTADRPPELRNIGTPQTIDQLSLYGSSPRLFIDAAVPDDAAAATHLASKAWLAATVPPPGPIHLNLPFAEPLLEATTPVVPQPLPVAPQHPPSTAPDIPTLRISGRRGLIIAGRNNDPDFPAACAELAARTGYPIIADPLSGLRYGPHASEHVLGYGDSLAATGLLEDLDPTLVLRFGPVPTSKPVWTWLQDHSEVEQVLIEASGRDATRSAAAIITADPTQAARALVANAAGPTDPHWLAKWRRHDEAISAAIAGTLAEAEFPTEPGVARTLLEAAPAGSVVTVGSSMPIRDVDTFGGTSPKPLRIVGNRGANGIDGIVSSALGAAASGANAVVLVGDVSLFHDLNALGTAAQLELPITVVVVHNDGGGIFHFLPHADPQIMDPTVFETYLATPHQTDFSAVAKSLGVAVVEVSTAIQLASVIAEPAPGPRLIQIRTTREANLELHRAVDAAVADSVARPRTD